MKLPHLFAVDAPAAGFAPLFAAAAAAGLRGGWLDLADAGPAPPAGLAATGGAGLLRAVVAGPDGTLAWKPRRGAPVLRDLLREHFRGCAFVLVRGTATWPRLAPQGEGWELALAGGQRRALDSAALLALLRRPRLAD